MSTLRGLLRRFQNVLQNDRLPQVQRVGVVRARVLGSFFQGILFSIQVFKGEEAGLLVGLG